jgi:phosphoketolase
MSICMSGVITQRNDTTSSDMTVLNNRPLSRGVDVIQQLSQTYRKGVYLNQEILDKLIKYKNYIGINRKRNAQNT